MLTGMASHEPEHTKRESILHNPTDWYVRDRERSKSRHFYGFFTISTDRSPAQPSSPWETFTATTGAAV
jgi:hypothetical protein